MLTMEKSVRIQRSERDRYVHVRKGSEREKTDAVLVVYTYTIANCSKNGCSYV